MSHVGQSLTAICVPYWTHKWTTPQLLQLFIYRFAPTNSSHIRPHESLQGIGKHHHGTAPF